MSGELFDDLWVLARSSWNFVSERGKEAIMIDIANIVIAYFSPINAVKFILVRFSPFLIKYGFNLV